jgi:6-phosphogluconolactonase
LRSLTRRLFLVKLASFPIAARFCFAVQEPSHLMFAGTDTGAKSKSTGIYAYRWEPVSGALSPLGLAARTASPTYMTLSPNRRLLYAVNEVNEYHGSRTGTVSSFELNGMSGMLTFKNLVSSGGAGPASIAIDQTGKAVFVADGAGGSLTSFQVLLDGRLSDPVSNFHFSGHSVNPERQKAAYTHCTVVSPDNRYLLVNDLGLDRITTYHFDPSTAILTPNAAPFYQAVPGSGPRNLTFHPNSRWAYSANEMGSTIDALVWDSRQGTLTRLQNISALPPGFTGQNETATVRVDLNGRFLYASNRGADTIVVFSINGSDGTLRQVQQISCGGKTPRYFAIDPSDRWLLVANQDSANIVVFARNPATGILKPTSNQYQIDFPMFLIFQ